MPDRSRLHDLVDSLPKAALNVAQGTLEHWQTWPPRQPEQVRAIRQADMDRMRRSMRPALAGAVVEAVAAKWDRAAESSTATTRILIGRAMQLWS